MSEPARNRFALDLEDLERQLRNAGQAPRVNQAADPLAELTRIVDQGDPLKELFKPRGAAPAPERMPSSWQAHAQQPRDAAEAQPNEPRLSAIEQFQAVADKSPPPAELRGALDEFEALLRRSDVARPAAPVAPAPMRVEPRFEAADESFERPEPQAYQRPVTAPSARDLDQPDGSYGYQDQPVSYDPQPVQAAVPSEDDMPDLEPRRSRKGLYAAAALIVVGVVGVGAAMSLRGPSRTADGQPPTIAAATGPTKVEPANPGGAEIPDQNKQIYERPGDAQSGQTKVVSREEQPVDVQQAARSMPMRVVMPGPGSATATPPANALSQAPAASEPVATPAEPALTPVPPVPGLGEPRRVRTVSIRPDGTPAPPANTAANGTAGSSNGVAPLSTGSAPPARPAGLAPAASSAPAAVAAAPVTPSRPATTPPAEAPKAQERAAAPATTPSAPLRIANAAPAAPAPAAPATSALRAGTGDFVVQLGAPGSEAEARATFAALQRKYPGQLSGQAPIVRKTELAGGKTVYRLRVGPYSREQATSMCSALQAAGGQCFIAKN